MKQVKINGKKYDIRFSLRALMKFEKMAGVSLSSFKSDDDSVNKEMTIEQILILCYCGLEDGGVKAKKKLSDNQDFENWFLEAVADDADIVEQITAAFTESQTAKKKKTTKA